MILNNSCRERARHDGTGPKRSEGAGYRCELLLVKMLI